MTPRQAEVLAHIKQFHATNGYMPTVRELGESLDINSPNGTMCHLRALERQGYLSRPRVNGKCLTRTWKIVEVEE